METINVTNVVQRLRQMNAEVLDLLDRAKGLDQDLTEAITDEAFAAGTLVGPQPEVPPTRDPTSGAILNPGEMRSPGWIGKLTQEQYDDLKKQAALLSRLVKALDTPTGTGTNAKSLAQLLRARGARLDGLR